jgi:hypothetical protein
MTDMHLWNTPIARVRALLVATIALGVLLFVVATTEATSAKQPPHGSATGQSAVRTVPAAPAGTRGPITLSCSPGGGGVVGAAGPAGPQGPIGLSCAASPTG